MQNNIEEIKKLLYQSSTANELDNVIYRLEAYVREYEDQYNWQVSLPTEVVDLILEAVYIPTLYMKANIGKFVDFLYIDMFSEEEREKLLTLIYKHFNDYPPYTSSTYAITYTTISIVSFLYRADKERDKFIDFIVKLYPSCTAEKQYFLWLYLLPEDIERVKEKLEVLNIIKY